MTKEQSKIPAPFASEEEFQKVYEECLEDSPQATPAIKKWYNLMGQSFDEYLAAYNESNFRYAYECGWNAAINAMKENQNEGDVLNFPINKETFVVAWLENCRKTRNTITDNDRLFAEVLSKLLNQAYLRGLADGRKENKES